MKLCFISADAAWVLILCNLGVDVGACQFEDTDKLPTKHQEAEGQGWIAFNRV